MYFLCNVQEITFSALVEETCFIMRLGSAVLRNFLSCIPLISPFMCKELYHAFSRKREKFIIILKEIGFKIHKLLFFLYFYTY